MKKLIAMLLALVCVLGLCAGCKGSGGSADSDGLTADGKVLLTIGLPSDALILDLDNNALTRWMEEKTGYELKFIPYSGGSDIPTQISTAVAAQQTLPDIIMGVGLGDGVVSRYGDDQYFIDLQDYFADKDGASKTFWTRLDQAVADGSMPELDRENVIRLMTEPETGAIYSVPMVETSYIDIMDYQMWINQKWLDKLGMKAPTNIDELYDTLVAFKTKDPNGNGLADEVPLYGLSATGTGTMGGDVINWLINQFLYYDNEKIWNVDSKGKLYAPYTTDEYREALKFINKLIDERLMLDSVFTTGMNEMKQITTPASGTAICGIFAGHLTLHVATENELLYEYVPLKPLENQRCVFSSNINRRQTFITADCKHPDEAFNLLMTMWSEEASMRLRYGEYGVNWTDADEGAKSDLGLDATFKLIRDPLREQNTCRWGTMGATLNVYSEGETAQIDAEQTPWLKYRSESHAQSRRNYDAAAEKNNPEVLCPALKYTEAEQEASEQARTATGDYYNKMRTSFAKGEYDPNNDAHWNEYLKNLEKFGLKDVLSLAQKAYDRQK